MDNLTHSLAGALLGQAGLKRKTGLAMPALVIGANLPDVDGVCMLLGTEGLALRRGLTHGPIAWVLLPLALAAILWWFDRWQARRGKQPEGRLPVRFGWLYALSLVACLTHPALDWLNSYGIRFLAPFSQRWFYGDVLFIIDVWLWALLGVGTWLSLRSERNGGNGRRAARIVLLGALAYIGLNGALTAALEAQDSDDRGVPLVIANPVPLAFWERQMIGGGHGLYGIAESGGFRSIGDRDLHKCDLAAAQKTDPDVDAFLFWSRAPFVEHLPDGRWRLSDARFAARGGGRFSVTLPAATCAP